MHWAVRTSAGPHRAHARNLETSYVTLCGDFVSYLTIRPATSDDVLCETCAWVGQAWVDVRDASHPTDPRYADWKRAHMGEQQPQQAEKPTGRRFFGQTTQGALPVSNPSTRMREFGRTGYVAATHNRQLPKVCAFCHKTAPNRKTKQCDNCGTAYAFVTRQR